MDRHCENAQKVAEYLQSHSKVAWIRFPGLPTDTQHEKAKKYLNGKGGAMVVFGLKTDDPTSAGRQFIDSLKLFSHVANVGDARSLAIHPASTTHSQMNSEQQVAAGVEPEMVRLSIGIETCDDIIKDLDQALEEVVPS
jgi:O-acetylhomoserine (thiol)-lyase